MNNNEEKASFKKFINLIKSTNVKKGLFFTGVLLTLIGTAGSLIVPLLTQMFIDGFNTDLITMPLVILIIAVFLGSAVIDGISYYMLAKIGQTVVRSLREKVWAKFLKLPVSYFDKTKSGESVSRVVNDTSIIQNLITSHFPQLISGVLSVAGSVIILFFLDWKLTLIMFVSLPISIAVIMPLGSRMQKVSKKLQDETAAFTGTIGLKAGDYTDEDIERAVKQSYTSEFIDELPDGILTEVGERGVKLSGGQRQRIGIARAFLRNPQILMLDEATASLDSQSEKYVGEALNELMAGRTVLVIAHRLSTIVNSDKIYFIDSGHLTGEGTHIELMASHDMYRAFTEQQFGED